MKIQYHLDNKKLFIVFAIIISIFAVDQFTKWLAFQYLQPAFQIKVLGDFFRLTFVENYGMAFGIRIANKIIFNTLSIMAAMILIFYLTHLYPGKSNFTYSIAIILGGAFGNLYDRLFNGKVIDFFDFDFWDVSIPAFDLFSFHFSGYLMNRWPVFNIADIAVSLGMIIIFFNVFREYDKNAQSEKKRLIPEEISVHMDLPEKPSNSMITKNE